MFNVNGKSRASVLPVDSEFAIVQKNYCSGGNFSSLKGYSSLALYVFTLRISCNFSLLGYKIVKKK